MFNSIHVNLCKKPSGHSNQMVSIMMRMKNRKYIGTDFDFVLQQHLLFGVSGWRGERAGRLSQPAAGREFQSGIVRCQKEFCPSVVLALRCL